jgi:hypothetical protein
MGAFGSVPSAAPGETATALVEQGGWPTAGGCGGYGGRTAAVRRGRTIAGGHGGSQAAGSGQWMQVVRNG